MDMFNSGLGSVGSFMPQMPTAEPEVSKVEEPPSPSVDSVDSSCDTSSVRVSLEYIPEHEKAKIEPLVPTSLPSLWSHQWIKSYADDRLLYASIWDARTPLKRRAVVVFSHGFGLHSHVYDSTFLKSLARNDFIAFSYDRRGHGRSGRAGGVFGDMEADHNARLSDLAAVIDAATHTYPGLPIFLAGHGIGAVDDLCFLSRWSKSSQARLVTGALLFSPGYGEGYFCYEKMKVQSNLSKIYPALVLTGHVTAAMMESTDGMALVVVAARKLFRRYAENNLIDETMLERCLNVPLKMDISDVAVHQMFEGLTDGESHLHVEEFIMAILLAGSPDEFVCAPSFVGDHMDSLAAHTDSLLDSRVHDVKPPLYWVHGTNDQVNTLEWAEKVIKEAGTPDTTMKLYPELKHGVFMDEDAKIVVQEAITWIGDQLKSQSDNRSTPSLKANTSSMKKQGTALSTGSGEKTSTKPSGEKSAKPMNPNKPLGTHI